MTRLILRRLAMAVPLVFLVSILTFVIVALSPGDPAYMILGSSSTAAQRAAYDHQMGFDLPVWEQYLRWLGKAVHGDFGTSFLTAESVSSVIWERLPVTLSLVVCGTLVGAFFGILLGLVSGLRGGWLGRSTEILSMFGMAIPNFWFGLVLMQLFAVRFGWLPATGYVPLTESPIEWARSLVMPVIALSLPAFTGIAKQTRDAVRDTLSRDYVRMLRASGIPEWRIVFVHVLRNSAIPVLTAVGLLFIGMTSGTVFVESVFAMQGLGGLAQSSAMGHDLAVIQAVAVVFCLIVVAANLVTDLAYGWANPKARVT